MGLLGAISRRPQPSFPRKRESRTVLPYDAAALSSHCGIPAYAGMTVGAARTVLYRPKILSILFIHV